MGTIKKLYQDQLVGGSGGAGQEVYPVTSTLGVYDTDNNQLQGVLDKLTTNLELFTCGTSAATATKAVSASKFVLMEGGSVKIKFTYANSATSPTLAIGTTAAKPIIYNGAEASASNSWEAGEVVEFYYDGTNWVGRTTTPVTKEQLSQLGQKVDDVKKEVGISVPYSITIDSRGGKYIPYIGKAGDKLNITLSADGVVSTETAISICAEDGDHVLGTFVDGQTIDVVLPIDITKFYLWIGQSAYLGPGTVSLIIKDSDNIADRLNKKIDVNNSYVQFSGEAKPTIEKSASNKYTITFPSGSFYIRYNNGGNILNTSSYAGQSFEIPYDSRLVFDRSDSTIKVVSVSGKGDYILLLANVGSGVDGLFSNFCIELGLQKEIDDNDVFAYFGSGDKPTFTKSGTTVNVAFPSNALTIYYNNGGTLYTLSAFASQNWDVPAGRKLVYNIDNDTISVVTFNTVGNYVVLFENGIRGFSGLLASYYLYMSAQADNESTERSIDPVLYFASYTKPSFAKDTQGQIVVTFPNAEMRIYARNGGAQIVSTTAFANQSFTVGQLKRLVYSLTDGTISVKSYADTAAKQLVLLANRNGMVLSGLLLPYFNDWLASNDIINANNIAEVTNIFQQANFPAKIATTNQSKQLVFLHFSDIHFSSTELDRIAHLAKVYEGKITDVLCTGDLVARSYNETADADFTTFWAEAVKYLVAIGNHDTAKYDSGVLDWTYYAGKDAYDRYLAPYISGWGVTQPSNAATNGYCYYYKDYTQEGIRLIVLDGMKYDTAQDDWFKSVLASAQTSGLAVIVANHFPPADITHTNNIFDAPGPDYWAGSSANILNPLAATAVDGFIAGALTGMTSAGEFICWLAGHTHKDTFAQLTDHPNQYCVLITCATASNLYGDQDRVRGTKSQDAVNVVSVDAYAKKLRLFRIGADRDRLFRHRHALCWDYSAKTLTYES